MKTRDLDCLKDLILPETFAKYKKANKKFFNNYFKKKKKELIKEVKDFQVYDYIYLIYIIQQVLEIWIKYYSDPDNLLIDVADPETGARHENMLNNLIKAKHYFDLECTQGLKGEREAYKHGFKILSEIICDVWD